MAGSEKPGREAGWQGHLRLQVSPAARPPCLSRAYQAVLLPEFFSSPENRERWKMA